MMDKGAVVSLPYGVEGFATPKHLVKEDGSQAKLEEKLLFKVIEFNKETRRIIISHSRVFEYEQKAAKKESEGKAKGSRKETIVTPVMEKTTLGDIEELAALKEKMDGETTE
jgi:small subunit ribosomal protein S1